MIVAYLIRYRIIPVRSAAECQILYLMAPFFGMFTVPLLYGDPATVLAVPRSIVLTESVARKYFADENPLGRMLRYNDQVDLTVTGVCEDYPDNSHFTFQALVSFTTLAELRAESWLSTWGKLSMYNYVQLDINADLDFLMDKMPEFSGGRTLRPAV